MIVHSSITQPLRDGSDGLLKGWPGGELILPGNIQIPMFRPALTGETPRAIVTPSKDRTIYCKYCYQKVTPLLLREYLPSRITEMTICASCGAGLTEPTEAA